MPGPRRAVLATALCTLAIAGCGLGPGEQLGGGVELRVTRSFGHELLASAEREQVRESDTVMRLLQEEREVETAYGGGFVQSIDGLEGGGTGGYSDWFYWVNGVEAEVGAADYALTPGDVVQWDHRYWRTTMRIPAIVGAYPEPFLHGTEDGRLPTRVECAEAGSAACEDVKRRLADADVPVTGASLGAPAGPEILRVVVAPWSVARELRAVAPIERGPQASGVFARFDDGGSRLSLLDERGEEVGALCAGAGLVAATRPATQSPVWVVTGVDEPGVDAAAAALEPETLQDAFAVAIAPGEGALPLPLVADAGGEAASCPPADPTDASAR